MAGGAPVTVDFANQDDLPLHKVKKGALRDQVGEQIKELILTNRLRPGQHIVIDKLANYLGVSHTPVREALAMLELEGLVVLNLYQNPRVAKVSAQDVREVYEMRNLVECFAVEAAAKNLTDEVFDRLVEMLRIARQDALVNNYQAHLQSDLYLHETILQSAANKLYKAMAQRVHERSIRIRSLVESTGNLREVLSIIDEHDQIIAALRTHDTQRSVQAMKRHLENGLQRTLAVLENFTEMEVEDNARD
jgi:DNA-binding GntR family transcriptional regulator